VKLGAREGWAVPCFLSDSRYDTHIQSNLSYVTFQGNSEIWSHKTGGRLIQV